MNEALKTFLLRTIAVLLLVPFAGDALAIWDFLEPTGPDSHFVSVEQGSATEAHSATDTEHEVPSPDACTLCPCCVSSVTMAPSNFTFPHERPPYALLTSVHHPLLGYTKFRLFHPPRQLH